MSTSSKSSSSISRILIAVVLLLLSAVAIMPLDAIITANRATGYVAGDFRRIVQLSEIFGHGFGLAVTLYLLWILAPLKRRLIPRLAACAVLPGIFVQLIKLVVARRRPGFYYPEYTDSFVDTWIGVMPTATLNHEYVTQSFPSAHAATAIGLATGLAWLFPQARVAFFLLGALAAFQRVVAGAHWSSDVIAGAAVGVLVGGIVFRVRAVNRLFARIETPKSPSLAKVEGESDTRQSKPLKKAA